MYRGLAFGARAQKSDNDVVALGSLHPPLARERGLAPATEIRVCTQDLQLDLIGPKLVKVLVDTLFQGCLNRGQMLRVGVSSRVNCLAAVLIMPYVSSARAEGGRRVLNLFGKYGDTASDAHHSIRKYGEPGH